VRAKNKDDLDDFCFFLLKEMVKGKGGVISTL
jgi:hypothetical protein